MTVLALRIVGRPGQPRRGAEIVAAPNEDALCRELRNYVHASDFGVITGNGELARTTLNAAGWSMPDIGELRAAQHFICAPLSADARA
jgi:hypothetical protein